MRFRSWVPALAGLLYPVLAVAANGVTDKFDGSYAGEASVNPALSSGSCGPFTVGKVTIKQGNLRTEAKPDLPWIIGIVTEDGYVQASMVKDGGARRPLDGRIDANGVITAGWIDSTSNCTWQIELKRVP